jgi:hypothetical protein
MVETSTVILGLALLFTGALAQYYRDKAKRLSDTLQFIIEEEMSDRGEH